ncbi:hypothetical protein ASPCAL14644 [Aspergillus calidoustus]|uniref:Linalool dehydratase/isomerase domain-containing protein n=1 Tax=Aspergillus calidoustus TaxID=454130 RepID=A0A0U5GJI0_ASPCI|nr:hypothetical protein ASPCAL14644 [Aspergillus calidoustus]
MYSGHLLLMVSLYRMLFNDDKYNEENALSFTWNPIFWGMGPENIFIVCNQFLIIAMKYNDSRDGTNVVKEVLSKYSAAWKEKGMMGDNGLFISCPITFALRDLIAKEHDLSPDYPATITQAREIAANTPTKPEPPFPRPVFGYILLSASELGDDDGRTLRGLLNHVDRFFNPTWQDGGLYYPVNPRQADDDGKWTEVEPFTGNSAVAYARLNVRGGQRKMWEEP